MSLVYAAVGTGRDERKRERALELIESLEFGTSAQVLEEFYVTVVKKASRPLSPAEALEWIEQWTAFPCQAIDHQLVRIAIEQSERYAGPQPACCPSQFETEEPGGTQREPELKS